MYSSSFLKKYNLHFIPNILYEDVPFFVELINKVKCISYCVDYLYNYRVGRNGAITSKKNEKQLDIIKVKNFVEETLKAKNTDCTIKKNFKEWYKWNYIWMYKHLPNKCHRKALKEISNLPESEKIWILKKLGIMLQTLYFIGLPIFSIKKSLSRTDIFVLDIIPIITIIRKK